MRKTGTIVWQPRSCGMCSARMEDLVLSQEDKQIKHRSAREISHENAILRLSVHRIMHRDLQLKCFKRRRAQLLSEANIQGGPKKTAHRTHGNNFVNS